jgi:hypothetical protein
MYDTKRKICHNRVGLITFARSQPTQPSNKLQFNTPVHTRQPRSCGPNCDTVKKHCTTVLTWFRTVENSNVRVFNIGVSIGDNINYATSLRLLILEILLTNYGF